MAMDVLLQRLILSTRTAAGSCGALLYSRQKVMLRLEFKRETIDPSHSFGIHAQGETGDQREM